MKTRWLPIREVSEATRGAMCRLLEQHFVGVTEASFQADLSDKTHALLLYDAADRLVGFSTLAMYTDLGPDGRSASIVCSGDTIVAPEAWGSSHLPRAWVRGVHALHERSGNRGLYWLLMTSGFRTYRFLPVFVKRFYPACDERDRPELCPCLARLARSRWGSQYDAEIGVVRLAQPQRLRGCLAHVPAGQIEDPHIAYFLARNPGYADGDELVCLASLSRDNLNAAGLRMLGPATPAVDAPRCGV